MNSRVGKLIFGIISDAHELGDKYFKVKVNHIFSDLERAFQDMCEAYLFI